jgi:hypothetical protein
MPKEAAWDKPWAGLLALWFEPCMMERKFCKSAFGLGSGGV